MIEADTPNLWEIRAHTDHATAVAIIVTALIHLSRLVNLPKESNLDVKYQIGEIANDVIEEYGYLKVEEVKYILKTAVRENKIYGRLDYAVVMQWVEDYARLRTGLCTQISDNENNTAPAPDPGAISLHDYIGHLRSRAENGDDDAAAHLAHLDTLLAAPRPFDPEAFRAFRARYLASHLKNPQPK